MEDVNLDNGNSTVNKANLAVKITEAYKSYSPTAVILNGFNMNVEEGTIYGLLGPSGCGKTTLLSCIVGRSRLDAGHIQLSVKKKKDIGYMPQELALYHEFNILETLHYFGSLYEMSYEEIKNKGEKLIKIMELPSVKTQFGLMSGGQQRRFSLCTALLHDPSLLILDEPTVGLDPIISTSIWEYLRDLANRGKTIIITTHYIEEARLSNKIGLMRKGILLSEATPRETMASCNADTLESAFLILSQKQSSAVNTEEIKTMSLRPVGTTSLKKTSFISLRRLKAQLLKNWYWSIRNWSIVLFVYMLPVLVITIFNLTIGRMPKPIHLGIINDENPSSCLYQSSFDLCDSQIPLSCKYIHEMEKHLTLKHYDEIQIAKEDTMGGSIWGYVKFEKNFTEMIRLRYENPTLMNSQDINESVVKASLDMSNYVVSKLIQGRLVQSYRDLSSAFKSCNTTTVTTVNSLPLKMMNPVYGTYQVNIATYGAAAVISIVEMYLTFMFTALSINMEKSSGLIERSLVSGLTVLEVIIAHLVVQMIMLVVQTITAFVLQFTIFKHLFLSTWIWPFLIAIFQGVCGSFFGLAASITFDDEKTTTFCGVFMVMSQVFLSGIMWPLEGMNVYLKKFTMFLPLTKSIEAIRSLNSRNFGISHPIVWEGFASILIWIVVAMLITMLSLKLKHGFKPKK